jgi:hypothetical protein
MSILDRMNLFSIEQAITASAASTDVIDLGSVGMSAPGSRSPCWCRWRSRSTI